MKISLKERHIEHGVAKDCGKCPLALAFDDILPAPLRVEVGATIVQLFSGQDRITWTGLPNVAMYFVRDFDAGKEVFPFNFEIKFDVPVTITEEDIAMGCKFVANNCPAARAIARALRLKERAVSICLSYAQVFSSKEPFNIYSLPPELSKFIRDFDSGLTVHPFSFTLTL